jgi:hypothetical protein
MRDTTREVDDFYAGLFNSFSGEERMMIAAESFESAKAIVLSSMKPGLSESEQRMELLTRFYGDELDSKQIEAFRKLNREKIVKRKV